MLIPYRNYTVDVREGDVVLFRTPFQPFKNPISILSYLVRLFTQCAYNHSAIVSKINGVLYLVEAKEKGVIANPLGAVLERKNDSILILRRTFVPKDCSERANSLIGRAYDFINLLAFQAIFRLPRLFSGKYGTWYGPTGEDAASAVVCSEVCAYAHSLPEFYWMASSDFIGYPGFKIAFVEPLD